MAISARAAWTTGLLLAACCGSAPAVSGGGEGGPETIATPSSLNERFETTGHHLFCYAEEDRLARTVVRGDFFGNGGSSGLVLWNSRRGCAIASESGGRSARMDKDYAMLTASCRDPAADRDYAIVHLAAGKYHWIQVWTGGDDAPKLEYSEGWGEEQGYSLVAADGTCLWPLHDRARRTHREAMSALQVGKEVLVRDGHALPSRALSSEAVRRWLAALADDGGAWFQGAKYTNAASRRRWGIVQIVGFEVCGEVGGAVLALDRETGAWRSIYDVHPGCAKVANYGMRGMVVDGDRLYATLCTDCMFWGDWADFAIDLRSGRAVRLDRNPWAPRRGEENGEGNMEILDPVAEFFPE